MYSSCFSERGLIKIRKDLYLTKEEKNVKCIDLPYANLFLKIRTLSMLEN